MHVVLIPTHLIWCSTQPLHWLRWLQGPSPPHCMICTSPKPLHKAAGVPARTPLTPTQHSHPPQRRRCHSTQPAATPMAYQWQSGMQANADDRRVHPAPERNKEPILSVLRERLLANEGVVLEVASGTGQHVAHFAAALSPQLKWQPTDLTPQLFPSICAHTAALPNVRPPALLDASAAPDSWPVTEPVVAVYVANMTHISPWEVTLGLLRGAAHHLRPGGQLFIYGPCKVDGAHTSDSNAQFDAQLRASNPAWGYRDQADIVEAAKAQGLQLVSIVPMPANNFIMLFEKPQA